MRGCVGKYSAASQVASKLHALQTSRGWDIIICTVYCGTSVRRRDGGEADGI
jgi:hypothetical protein